MCLLDIFFLPGKNPAFSSSAIGRTLVFLKNSICLKIYFTYIALLYKEFIKNLHFHKEILKSIFNNRLMYDIM